MATARFHGDRRARHPPAGTGARCRSVRFFTHLPGAGPSPGKPGGPDRAHKGRARAARPRQASVRPPGHARPRTSQDTGQTTARRSRRRQPPPARKCTQERKRPPAQGKKKRPEKHAGNSPGIDGREHNISYNLGEGEKAGRDKSPAARSG